jgi:hypothetical protein
LQGEEEDEVEDEMRRNVCWDGKGRICIIQKVT